MKKMYECLDLILQTLADNGGLLCFYESENSIEFSNKKIILPPSPAYYKLFNNLELNNDESIQLLEMLKERKYLDYETHVGGIKDAIPYKIKSKNSVGQIGYNDSMQASVLKPTNIKLTLKGKFFILAEGGYTEKHKKKLLLNLQLWITAIGTGLGGLYIVGKIFIWFCSFFYF